MIFRYPSILTVWAEAGAGIGVLRAVNLLAKPL
jgi:hypothetical protein